MQDKPTNPPRFPIGATVATEAQMFRVGAVTWTNGTWEYYIPMLGPEGSETVPERAIKWHHDGKKWGPADA